MTNKHTCALISFIVAGAAMVGGVPEAADHHQLPTAVGERQSAGVRLPQGFTAQVFASGIGSVRHLAVADNGWVYAPLRRNLNGFGAVALHDSDGDGVADETHYFAEGLQGTGSAIYKGYYYMGSETQILRWSLADGPKLSGAPEVVVDGLPQSRPHEAKPITFDAAGYVYTNVGAPSNACMAETRTKGSPGLKPCPQLETSGAVFRFKADKLGQTFAADKEKYSTGHRNAVALEWNSAANSLYLVQHGRDQLHTLFPNYYSQADSAELPAEEFHKVTAGDNLGWPYSYYDHRLGKRMLSPEYGGDGQTEAPEGKKPILGFPGHWAPNDLLFVSGKNKPADMQGAALIAFHGSWNRRPIQQGYSLILVPMDDQGNVGGQWVTFADQFEGSEPVVSPRRADHRPTGLAEGPDGALYVASSMRDGKIWKITYDKR